MITVVIGPTCAGKSTYVAEHVKPGQIVVDFDHIAQALGATSRAYDKDLRQCTRAAWHEAATYVIDCCRSGWIIHSTPSPAAVLSYRRNMCRIVVIDPGRDVVTARCRQLRPPAWERYIDDWYASADIYRQWAAA